MGQAVKIERYVFSPTIDASTMAERVMQFSPASEAEKAAKALFEQAQGADDQGDLDLAKQLYAKVVDAGESTVRKDAEARLKALGGR